MRPGPRRSTTLLLGMLVTYGTVGHAQEKRASWLDAPSIASWNTAGQAIPAAPGVEDPVNPRCRDQARPPKSDEDKQVRDRGWDLVGAVESGSEVLVVRGTASYDGMCRPLQFQAFVFVRGRFAGTLAPAPMDSRMDGALSRVTLDGPTGLTAEYLRYEESDPRCCASRITRVTFDIAGDPPVVRARSASTSPTKR